MTNLKKKNGKKRAIITAGALLGAGALISAAAFTDFALLNLNGEGGFGGADNAYNLVVSNAQEAKVSEVGTWVEANPEAEDVAPIEGADSLVPGGAPLYVNLPVKNDSKSMGSTLAISFENITDDASESAEQIAKNVAYAGLISFEVAEVDDASDLTAAVWQPVSGFDTAEDLSNLAKQAGKVIVVKVSLDEGSTQEETNAANGGGVEVQARFDGSSI